MFLVVVVFLVVLGLSVCNLRVAPPSSPVASATPAVLAKNAGHLLSRPSSIIEAPFLCGWPEVLAFSSVETGSTLCFRSMLVKSMLPNQETENEEIIESFVFGCVWVFLNPTVRNYSSFSASFLQTPENLGSL